ncbi:MAG: hypothetical protein PHU47_00110 [Candidatus ainarchaeum sp.]|nr:hypothetical protein [Candidatus ainarchaeum sp.]
MNKGFIEIIGVIFGIIILLIVLDGITSISCINEKNQIRNLTSNLEECNNNLNNLNNDLEKCLFDKEELNQKLNTCQKDLDDCINDLEKCNLLISKLIDENEELKEKIQNLKVANPNQIIAPAIVSSIIPILFLIIILFSISPKIHIFKLDIKKTISYIFEHCLFPYFYKSNLINKIFTFINIVLIIIIIFCIQIISLLKSAGLLRLF